MTRHLTPGHTRTLIMAVPWDPARTRRAIELSRATGGTIVWDETYNAYDTWTRALHIAGDDPVIMLEDDIILAPRWRDRVEQAIAQRPLEVIQFFSIKPSDLDKGSRQMPAGTFSMNQCYYLPATTAAQLAAHAPRWRAEHPETPTAYDYAMREWMRDTNRSYWLHVPSLVQHERWRSGINPRRSSGRQSPTFEGETR